MAWLLVLFASAFEIAFALPVKASVGVTRPIPSVFAVSTPRNEPRNAPTIGPDGPTGGFFDEDGTAPTIVLAMRRAFPDLHFTIDDVAATPDAIAIQTTMTGTHDGDLFGIAPTHRRVHVTQIQIERVRGGRIVEHWRVTDELTLMRQLGVVP